MTDDLDARAQAVAELLDKQAIRDCVCRYGRGIDRHDEEFLRTVFHPDAIDTHGDVTLGRDEFITWGNKWHENVSASHSHNMTSHFSDVDGNEAHAMTYVIFGLCRKDGTTLHVGGGRYIDRLQRRDGEWKVIVRQITIDWRFNADRSGASSLAGHPHGTWDSTDPSHSFFSDEL